MFIGKKLRYYRKKNGLTQKGLAKDICDTTYVSKIENDKSEPPDETLDEFCQKLGITLEQLTENVDADKKVLLNDWYDQITHRNENTAKTQYHNLESAFEKVEDPFLLNHYDLIRLRYFLLIKDKQKAEALLHKVKFRKDYVTSETEYDYNFILGLYEYHYGNLHTSDTYYKQAEKSAEEQNLEEPELFYYTALTLSRLFKVTHSTIYVYKALQAYNQEMNFERCTDCNLLLGINFNILEDYDSAEKYFQRVLAAADSHRKAELTKGRACHNLGNIYSKQGQSEKAIDMLLKGLQLKTEFDQKLSTLYLLAKEYFTIGDEEKAKEWLSEGLHHVKKSGDRAYQIKFNILQSQWVEKANSVLYRDDLKEAISYFKDRDLDFAYESAILLAESYAKDFHYKEAYKCLQFAHGLKKNRSIQ